MVKRMLVAAVATLVVASPAQAQLREAPGWRLARAQAVAAKVWHNPCPDGVKVSWALLPRTAEAWARMEQCAIEFNTMYRAESSQWPEFCTTMIHEYGHLAGFRDPANTADPYHSLNRNSVMYGGLDRSVSVGVTMLGRGRTEYSYGGYDRRCAYHGRRYLVLPYAGMPHEHWWR